MVEWSVMVMSGDHAEAGSSVVEAEPELEKPSLGGWLGERLT